MRTGRDGADIIGAWRVRMGERVSAQSLAVFRILFGGLILWDCWRFIKYDRIWRYWIAPEFHFTYPGFGWVAPLPEPWIQIAWLGVGLSALLVMIGLFYRIAIVALLVLFSYFFLIDKAEYLNHFYLVILFALLLCFIPAHRVWSVDSRLWPSATRDVAYAHVFILRFQMEIMLLFAGLVKLTPDWLAGEPLGLWLRPQAESLPFGWVLQYDPVIVAAAWGTIALHLIGAPLLMWRRTRLTVFMIYCVFHALNSVFFNIGIFPWVTIAGTLVFFAPDWPSQLWSCIRPAARPADGPPAPRLEPALFPAWALAAIAAWAAIQIALPLRSLAFPSEVRWAGDGHRFSWRMRIYDREAEGGFRITNTADGAQWLVDPYDYLTPRQAATMLTRADMIHQFANHLVVRWKEAGHGDVSVHAEIRKSLNGRPFQPYIDPSVDLAATPFNLFSVDPWVLPLEHGLWGVADSRPIEPQAAASDAVRRQETPARPE